jgi:hypothetical protein
LFTCWVPPFGKLGLWLTLSFAKKGGTFLYLWSFPLRCYPWIQARTYLINVVGAGDI